MRIIKNWELIIISRPRSLQFMNILIVKKFEIKKCFGRHHLLHFLFCLLETANFRPAPEKEVEKLHNCSVKVGGMSCCRRLMGGGEITI